MHQGMLLRGILFLKQVGKKEGKKQEVNGHQQKTEHEKQEESHWCVERSVENLIS